MQSFPSKTVSHTSSSGGGSVFQRGSTSSVSQTPSKIMVSMVNPTLTAKKNIQTKKDMYKITMKIT